MDGLSEPWAIWVVGLPGSGKSTLAKGIAEHLAARGTEAVLLQMDARRKAYFPEPTYTAQERETAYAMFADEAAELVAQGHNVIMDGSAYKASMRRYARGRIPRLVEIYVRCDLDEAIRRESARPEGLVMAGLYEKALRRKQTGEPVEGLGEVIGVDVEFETGDAEFVVDNTNLTKEETLSKTLHFLDTWFGGA